MLFYDCTTAPSPRRVRIFAHEKGISLPSKQVNLRSGEQFSDEFRAINPRCVVPTLVLEDGTVLSDSIAICRYLEIRFPDTPLMGTDAKEAALIEMRQREIELDGILAIVDAFRNGTKGLKDRALPGPSLVPQIPELVERGKARFERFMYELDNELNQTEFVAGETYSIADISLFVAIDFAGWIKMSIPDECTNLLRWHGLISSRSSAQA